VRHLIDWKLSSSALGRTSTREDHSDAPWS
jgi:hypothetical protein